MKNKFIYFGMVALLGILAAFYHIAIFMVVMGVFLFLLSYRKNFSVKYLLLAICFFIGFFIRTEVEIGQNMTGFTGEEKMFQLSFAGIGKFDGDIFTIEAIEQHQNEKLLVRYKIGSEQEKTLLRQTFSPGLQCQVTGKLKEPAAATNKNAFDYKTYLERNSIHWVLEPEILNTNSCQKQSSLLALISKWRFDGIHYIEEHFPEETVPFAIALIFGSSDNISAEMMDAYRELGLVHLLAISGLHITIVVAIVYFLLLRIGVTRERSIELLLFLLPIYGLLTGATPSVNRSILMTMIILIGRRWGRERVSIIDSISITLIMYVLISPYAIFNIGFQLSFLVTFALLMSSSILLSKFNHPIVLLLATSYISMIASAPILLYHFFEFSISTVIVNLLYIPLFNIILLPYVLFAFLVHLLIGPSVDLLLLPLNFIIKAMNIITEKLSALPWNTIVLGRPNLLMMALYVWGFFLFFSLWEKGFKRKWEVLFLVVWPFLLFTHQYVLTNYFLDGDITFIDVGQGDAILIKLPFGKGNYLIDTGGTIPFEKEEWQMKKDPFEIGEDTVVPFLKGKGVTKIDKLIITHGDVDHAGGALALFKEIKVKELVLPNVKEKDEFVERLVEQAELKKVKIKFVQAGESWQSGRHQFHILSPEGDRLSGGNDGSIVLYTELGGMGWLWTGDLEAEGEKKLIQRYPELKADVLKVGHHGSNTSTSEPFLKQLSPKVAVISVGKNNRYRHPHRDVIERLEKDNIIILRTDASGGIIYTFRNELGTFSVINP